jgi:hypothetical protein
LVLINIKDLVNSNDAWPFEIATREEQHPPNVILKDVDKTVEGAKNRVWEGDVQWIRNTIIKRIGLYG